MCYSVLQCLNLQLPLVARSKLLTSLNIFLSMAQGGDPVYRKAWAKICDISRTEFAKVYQRLRVELEEKVK